MINEVTIRVPATTANLGPGYDCLGVALQLYNRVTIHRERSEHQNPMVEKAAEIFFSTAMLEPFPFTWQIEGDVPSSRGLGSSVTVRLGILCGLNELSDRPLPRQKLFELCAKLEGHPDNAAPATFGGFTVANSAHNQPVCIPFPVDSSLRFVLLIPDFEIQTSSAREVLPIQVTHKEAADNCANAVMITAAFAQKRYNLLRDRFADHLHQPYREKELIPFLSKVISLGIQAGALGGFLSGSGSTIICVTQNEPERVALAMLDSARPTTGRTVICEADNQGVRVQ